MNFCDDLLQGKNIAKEKHKISTLILKEFFKRYPLILQKHGQGLNIDVTDDEIDEEKGKT